MLGYSCALCGGSTCGDAPVIGVALVCDRCARSIARQIGYAPRAYDEDLWPEAPAAIVAGPTTSSALPPPAEPSPEGSG